MIRRPPRSTLDRSSAASDVYKRQGYLGFDEIEYARLAVLVNKGEFFYDSLYAYRYLGLSLIHISEPTRPY